MNAPREQLLISRSQLRTQWNQNCMIVSCLKLEIYQTQSISYNNNNCVSASMAVAVEVLCSLTLSFVAESHACVCVNVWRWRWWWRWNMRRTARSVRELLIVVRKRGLLWSAEWLNTYWHENFANIKKHLQILHIYHSRVYVYKFQLRVRDTISSLTTQLSYAQQSKKKM